MKVIYLITLALMHTLVNAQNIFVPTDITIDLSIEMEDGQMQTTEMDLNQDGIADLRIYSWSNQSYQTGSAIEIQVKSNFFEFKGFSTNSDYYLNSCPQNPDYYNSGYAYLYRSDITRPYTKDYVLFPFRFTIRDKIHFAVLHVLYEDNIVKITGYNWHPQPLKTCDCQSAINLPYLTLSDTTNNTDEMSFQYYNTLGQLISEPKGVVFKVYENGTQERIYFP